MQQFHVLPIVFSAAVILTACGGVRSSSRVAKPRTHAPSTLTHSSEVGTPKVQSQKQQDCTEAAKGASDNPTHKAKDVRL